MFEVAAKALSQMVSPSFRAVLLKSIGLALVLIVLIAIGLQRLSAWIATHGATMLDDSFLAGTPLELLIWLVSFASAFGIIFGAIFLMPAVTAFVGSFFADEIAGHVERERYPGDPPGEPLPPGRSLFEGGKTALLAVLVYLCALPFMLVAGLGILIMFFAASYLLGREYFELAAMRFRSPVEAKALRRAHRASVIVAGMVIAVFVSIPIVNLATPLFATAFMVHMHKRLSATKAVVRRVEPSV